MAIENEMLGYDLRVRASAASKRTPKLSRAFSCLAELTSQSPSDQDTLIFLSQRIILDLYHWTIAMCGF